MRVTPDANVLIRAVIAPLDMEVEDRSQALRAGTLLRQAEAVCITLPALCELVWVLRQRYRYHPHAIADAVQALCAGATAVLDRAAVEAGVSMLWAGGDFADGVIAYQGASLGADVFVSFDRRAVRLLTRAGHTARLA